MQHALGFKMLRHGEISLLTSVIKVMIATDSYVPAVDDTYLDDGVGGGPAAYELGISGYARQAITADSGFTTTIEDPAEGGARLDVQTLIENITFSTLASGTDLTGSHFVIYAEGASDAASVILNTFPIGAITTNGGDLTMSGAGFFEELNNA